MVEIKHEPPNSPGVQSPSTPDDNKHRLIYSKSKVYVNPTAYARDNIPGFVALVKRVCAFSVKQGYNLIECPGSGESELPSCLDTRDLVI